MLRVMTALLSTTVNVMVGCYSSLSQCQGKAFQSGKCEICKRPTLLASTVLYAMPVLIFPYREVTLFALAKVVYA